MINNLYLFNCMFNIKLSILNINLFSLMKLNNIQQSMYSHISHFININFRYMKYKQYYWLYNYNIRLNIVNKHFFHLLHLQNINLDILINMMFHINNNLLRIQSNYLMMLNKLYKLNHTLHIIIYLILLLRKKKLNMTKHKHYSINTNLHCMKYRKYLLLSTINNSYYKQYKPNFI